LKPKTKKLRALIIEDELDICFLLSNILKQGDLNPYYVNNIVDAKSLLKNDEPDIIFLDNHLPDGFGIDLIPFIKKTHPQTKVVVLSAHDSTDDKNKAIFNGADIFMGKPFTKESIHNVLNKFSN
jgi:two-component system, OmpR family, response regulator